MKNFISSFKFGGVTAAMLALAMPFGADAAQSVYSMIPSQAPKVSAPLLGDILMKFPQEKAKSLKKAPAKAPAVPVNSTVKTVVVIDENFDKWTKGTESEPDPTMVTDEQVPELMNYKGDWVLYKMYQAGGCGYEGFEVNAEGEDDPGYIKSPALNLVEGENAYFRFTCRAKNVNADAREYGLQAFFFDEANSGTLFASSHPLTYNQWTDCEWIGSGCESTSIMAFSWKGKVLIDDFKVEKLIFPLATPKVVNVGYNKEGNLQVDWNKVEGATSYTVAVTESFDVVSTQEVGDVNSCLIDVPMSSDGTYTFYVMAHNGDKISYWGSLVKDVDDLAPEEVGTGVATDATDVTAEGFTANWTRADYANKYLVLPVQKHTAKENGEEFMILNENFSHVPESADDNHPLMICPMAGMGAEDALDLYLSRAGWKVDLAIMMRMMPDMPGFILSNMYASMGMPGMLVSPTMDFSVGGGAVKISGMAMTAVDDMVITASFVDAKGKAYASTEFELTTAGSMIDVTLEGGKPDSRLVFTIADAAEEDMVFFLNLAVSTTLSKGETITVPAETVFAENVTSARANVPVDDCNSYSYSVMGYYSNAIMGAKSNSIDVKNPASGVSMTNMEAFGRAYTAAGKLFIVNPKTENCEVYTLDGRKVFSTSDTSASIDVEKGVYVVKVGNKTYKVIG